MKGQTRIVIAKKILEMLYEKQEKGNTACDRDFRRMKGHAPSSVYAVRSDLITRGIIERTDKKYRLVLGTFRSRREVLKYVNFVRSGNPLCMKIGASSLREIYIRNTTFKAKDFEDFLRITSLETILKDLDVVEVTRVKEAWMLFLDLLGDIGKFDFLLRDLTDAIFGAVKQVKRHGSPNLLEMPLNRDSLGNELVLGIQKAITYITSSEDLYYAHERIVIRLLRTLRELNNKGVYLLNTIKALLRTPSPNYGRFSKLNQLSPEISPSDDRRFPDLWYATGDYSDLFKEVYRILRKMGKEEMRSILSEWVTQNDVNLQFGAWVFLSHLVKRG